jgi:hypothetical protein
MSRHPIAAAPAFEANGMHQRMGRIGTPAGRVRTLRWTSASLDRMRFSALLGAGPARSDLPASGSIPDRCRLPLPTAPEPGSILKREPGLRRRPTPLAREPKRDETRKYPVVGTSGPYSENGGDIIPVPRTYRRNPIVSTNQTSRLKPV